MCLVASGVCDNPCLFACAGPFSSFQPPICPIWSRKELKEDDKDIEKSTYSHSRDFRIEFAF